MSTAQAKVVVAWHRPEERDAFLEAWRIDRMPECLHLQRDLDREGCGATKNKGVKAVVEAGAEIVVVLDGDCYPADESAQTLEELIELHVEALAPQAVELCEPVTYPPSRGVPYRERSAFLPVAASMGFWTNVPDYCAVRQLALAEDGDEMQFIREPMFHRYFPLCGMNVAFRPKDWWPWCQFINVSRFDDIWMGWLWQREAYRRGYCFNLGGPLIHHARQSNVWKNLIDEAKYLEQTETLWREIALHPSDKYEDLLFLLPAGTAGLNIYGKDGDEPSFDVRALQAELRSLRLARAVDSETIERLTNELNELKTETSS